MPTLVSHSVGRRRPIVTADEPSGLSVRLPNVGSKLPTDGLAESASAASALIARDNPAARLRSCGRVRFSMGDALPDD